MQLVQHLVCQMVEYIMTEIQYQMDNTQRVPELDTDVMMVLLKRIMLMVFVNHGGNGIIHVSYA